MRIASIGKSHGLCHRLCALRAFPSASAPGERISLGGRCRPGSATEVMLADALVLRNLLHLNMISTRKPGQSITCLSLPEAPGLPVAGVPALAESVLAGRAPGGLAF